MPEVGRRFLIVDSKRTAVPFYESSGFTVIDSDSNKARDNPIMFLDLQKA